VLVIGLALGIVEALTETASDRAGAGGRILLTITDASGPVSQLGPPVVEITTSGGTVVFEQYTTFRSQDSGLRWDTERPVVVQYRTPDPTAEPGLTATVDMASLLAARAAAPRNVASREPDTLYVDVSVGPDRTVVVIRVDDEVLSEQSLPREDRWSEWTAAAEACAAAIEVDVTALVGRLQGLQALIESWSGRVLLYTDWVTEADRRIEQVRTIRGALPAADSDVAALRRGADWIADIDRALTMLEEDLQAFRSASRAESSRRFSDSFDGVTDTLLERVVPLAATASPALWCATG